MAVDQVGHERAQHDHRRVRNIGNVEHAKRDGDADRDRGIKPSEHDACHQGVGQKVENGADFHEAI